MPNARPRCCEQKSLTMQIMFSSLGARQATVSLPYGTPFSVHFPRLPPSPQNADNAANFPVVGAENNGNSTLHPVHSERSSVALPLSFRTDGTRNQSLGLARLSA